MQPVSGTVKLPVLAALLAAINFIGASLGAAAGQSLPDTMRAAAIDRGGDAQTLSIHHVPIPVLGAGDVLIAVKAAGVGVWQTTFRPLDASDTHFPVILGSDGTGSVAAIGAGVRGFKVGDEVYGTDGSFYAEYVALRADHVAHVPRGINSAEAAILGISGLSALQGIDDILNVKSGERLVIHGAAGGVGTLAIQFAKLRGAKVLATVSDDAGASLVRRLGADEVVNGRTGDIAAVTHHFAPDGVDAVLGLAGGEALEHCIDALRRDGRGRLAYLYGVQPVPPPRFGIRTSVYSYISGVRELAQLNKAVTATKLRVPIAAEYPLDEAAGADKRLEAGHLLGKIVLNVR